jgi:predicted secreted protein
MVATVCLIGMAAGARSRDAALRPERPQVRIAQGGGSGSEVLKAGGTATHVDLKVGQILEVRLAALLGAGLSWILVNDVPIFLRSMNERVERGSSPQQDSGRDIQVFSFEAVAEGEGRLVFEYRRPWLLDKRPEMRIEHTITVKRS